MGEIMAKKHVDVGLSGRFASPSLARGGSNGEAAAERRTAALVGAAAGSLLRLHGGAPGYDTVQYFHSDNLPTRIDETVFATVFDLPSLPGDITTAVEAAEAIFPEAKFILVGSRAHFEKDAVVGLLRRGAIQTLLLWPAKKEELDRLLQSMLIQSQIEASARQRGGLGRIGDDRYMVGNSSVMRDVFEKIRSYAQSGAAVLITGESGTGKELAARAIHDHSPFGGNPFIAINCGALPSDIIASELFGHEKGAFTGAHQRKLGRVEVAAGGTLFLDEIGDLPLAEQSLLLRFLQEGTIERVGGVETLGVKTRIVAGTNVDLKKAVAEGRFRRDLYYRLAVLCIELPPLRERDDDVAILAQFLLKTFGREDGRSHVRFSPLAMRAICTHTWPGNVRELASAVRRALVVCRRDVVTESDLGIATAHGPEGLPTLAQARDQAERAAILAAMRHCENRPDTAARHLDVSRSTLYKLFRKHHVAGPFGPEGERKLDERG